MNEQRITFHLDKLVRDKLPAMMEELGQEPEVRQLSKEELVSALIAKVAEELAELNPEEPDFKKELSQVLQAVLDLIELTDTNGEVEQLRQHDLAKRGGFLDGQYISALHLRSDDPWVNYYRKDPVKNKEG